MWDFWEPAAQEPPGDQTPAASNLSLEIQIPGDNTFGETGKLERNTSNLDAAVWHSVWWEGISD